MFTVDVKASWTEDLSDRIGSAFVVGTQAYYEENGRSGGTGARFAGPGLEVIEAGEHQSVVERRIVQ